MMTSILKASFAGFFRLRNRYDYAARLFDYVGHLPECPTWSEDESALYWTDILEQEIHRYHPASGTHSVLAFPEEVGCFALREQGGFIVAMRHAIWLADKNGLLQRKVCDNPSNTKLARSTMAALMAMDVFMPERSGRQVTIMARC